MTPSFPQDLVPGAGSAAYWCYKLDCLGTDTPLADNGTTSCSIGTFQAIGHAALGYRQKP